MRGMKKARVCTRDREKKDADLMEGCEAVLCARALLCRE